MQFLVINNLTGHEFTVSGSEALFWASLGVIDDGLEIALYTVCEVVIQ